MNANKLKVVFAAALTLAAGITVYNAQKPEVELSDLASDNVEALADVEVIDGYTGPSEIYDCPYWFTGDGILCKSENSHPCKVVTCK